MQGLIIKPPHSVGGLVTAAAVVAYTVQLCEVHAGEMKAFVVLALLTAHETSSSQTPVAVEPLVYSLGCRIVDGEANSGGNFEAMEMVVSAITEMVRSMSGA